ncbi:MAG TPA: peptidase M28, partial [Cyclobacteriaceae bacterium]|nr:peptidase M28 [Cyclobacteriaceae bacterium]
MKHTFSFLLSAMLIAGCATKATYDPQDGLDAFTEAGFEDHLKKLSSDEFMGRMPFTEGETKTLAYLEAEVKKLGLEPGNGTSYLQEVPLVEITT